jgi:PAS domain S-box-containing protein
MQLMSDEAQALTREIREETSSHLQAIFDNVKDAIVTVDDAGHIETFNPTGERIFGYSQAEILGRTLDFLLPEIDPRQTCDFSSARDARSTTRTSIWRHTRPGAYPRTARASRWRSRSARRI